MTIGWNHPLDNSRSWQGINDGDMEHFVAEPLVKSAREAIQNSLDAKHPDSDKSATVEFKLFDIDASDIPDLEDLKYNIHPLHLVVLKLQPASRTKSRNAE